MFCKGIPWGALSLIPARRRQLYHHPFDLIQIHPVAVTVVKLGGCRGKREPNRGTLVILRQAFEAAGIEFIAENGGGEGVRFRQPRAERT